MISKVKLVAGVLLLVATQSYVYADTSENGLELNGIELNGLELNGLPLNGLPLNGLQLNGVTLNGVTLNGVTLNGVTLNGLQAQAEETALNPLVSLADEPLAK